MLDAIMNIIEYQGSDVTPYVRQFIELCSQIMEADVSEEIKCKAINIFTSIGESCADVRKQQASMLQQFVMQYIIPSLVPSDEKLKCWLESGDEYSFQDNSLEATCENSISNLAFVLGYIST